LIVTSRGRVFAYYKNNVTIIIQIILEVLLFFNVDK